MSLFGVAAGRALAGLGAGAQSLASKYIDEELATQRAEAIAEIQRRYAQAGREDQAAFDDKRAPILRERAALDAKSLITAKGEATRADELAGLNDVPLQTARTARADAEAAAGTRRKVAEADALRPGEVERAGLIAEGAARAQAKYREPNANDPAVIKKKFQAIIDSAKDNGVTLSEDEKKVLYGIVSKPKEAVATEEVVTETVGKDGSTTKRTLKGPAGSLKGEQGDDPLAQLKSRVEKARTEGKLAEAIGELRKRGATRKQILDLGISEEELQAATRPAPATSQSGEPIQLLQPLYELGKLRRRMQDETNAGQ